MMNSLNRILLTLTVLLATGCFSNIDTGHVGVVKHFGAISPALLPEGFNWVSVWDHVDEISVQTGTTTSEAAGASKDLQMVHTKVAIQWALAQDKVVCIVQKFGNYDGAWTNGIMEPATQEVVKAVSARYTAEELVTKRSEAKKGVEDGLNEFIAKTMHSRSCDDGIRIANVAMTNFEFSPEFNASIEAKVKAEQDSLRAENEKRTRVTQAEATAKEKTLAADSIAYETDVESKARAGAITREAEALKGNAELIQLRTAERWNGVLPVYTGATVPMLQLKQ